MPTIREWLSNKTILITGAAGFCGKVLTEKLLRTCPGVKRIYLIIRAKRGKSPQERWDEIVKEPFFEKLLAQEPDIMERKVTILDGDMSLINLGLPQETIEELKNVVNIVFHSAATVRFNDPLQKAVLANTRGTLEMCKLAKDMINLEVFVHVSTTFCNQNLNKTYYEEKVYEPCQDWRTILKLIEEENPAVINTLCYKIIEDHPNTYTFSKSLSEKIVEDYSNKFPTVIARPAVVLGTLLDPFPGWTDNYNGILGVSAVVCKGVMRIFKGCRDCILDYIPVDTAINALIISSWEKANSDNKALSIYNCAYGDLASTFEELIKPIMECNFRECPMDSELWYPFVIFAKNDFYFHLLFFLLQVIPAVVVDSILFLMKKERRLMKITIKLYEANRAVSGFTLKTVNFESKNYKNLWYILTGEEAEIFPIMPPPDLTSSEVAVIMHKGLKKYLLKEKLEDIKYHKQKLRRLYYFHIFVIGILIMTAFGLLYKLLNTAIDREVV